MDWENSKIKIYEIFKELDYNSYLEYKKILEDLTKKYNLKFLDANSHKMLNSIKSGYLLIEDI